jgi:ribonuclease-3
MHLNYTFNDDSLFKTALTHKSFSYENKEANSDNERLEYLGDAVLELIISEELYRRYPEDTEGQLTRFRAGLVCEQSLAEQAKRINLEHKLRLGKGEERYGGRKKDSLLSDALEALIGAIYLDGGIESAREFVLSLLNDAIETHNHSLLSDYKTHLQEILQKDGGETAVYKIVDETGPDHDKRFTAHVSYNNKLLGAGKGRTKKEAEQKAAFAALNELNN